MTDTRDVLQKNNQMLQDALDAQERNATIHTIAFAGFLFFGITTASLWALLWYALSIYNGLRAAYLWNKVSELKAMKANDDAFLTEVDTIHNHWYDENGEMRPERIEEARLRLEQEEKEKA